MRSVWFATRGPTIWRSDGRRHRQAEPHDRRVGLLDGIAVLERADDDARHPRQQPVDDERRRVLDEHRRLAQAARGLVRRRDGFVSRVRRADELDERHERDGVEEVHADVGAHLRHGQRRRVRREHAVRPHDLAELGEHALLHVHLLDHRL